MHLQVMFVLENPILYIQIFRQLTIAEAILCFYVRQKCAITFSSLKNLYKNASERPVVKLFLFYKPERQIRMSWKKITNLIHYIFHSI